MAHQSNPQPRPLGPTVPDPHAGEPAPPPEEGLRPEADPAVVRPMEDEETGPVQGLLKGVTAGAEEEIKPGGDPEAEALLAQMGVEEEGIVHGQILGITMAVILSVVALVVVLYFLFYAPFRQETFAAAEDVEDHPELAQNRTEALDKLNAYTLIDETTYSIPISRAMGIVANQYGTGGPAATAAIPDTRQEFNTAVISYEWARPARQAVQDTPAQTPPPGPQPTGAPPAALTGEEVGVDEPVDDAVDFRNDE